ncbi:MAG: hypothetical protein ACK5KU_11530 [Beutenbergiaceae bacterium]
MSQVPDNPDQLEAALARVESLQDAPLAEHASAFEQVHELLQERLGAAEN